MVELVVWLLGCWVVLEGVGDGLVMGWWMVDGRWWLVNGGVSGLVIVPRQRGFVCAEVRWRRFVCCCALFYVELAQSVNVKVGFVVAE